jgi:hypothetical protein
MKKQSKELTKFYDDYWQWLQDGAPEGEPFSRRCGLCFAARRYGNCDLEMQKQFGKAGLSEWLPFGAGAYWRARDASKMHLSRKRRAWVDAHRTKPT